MSAESSDCIFKQTGINGNAVVDGEIIRLVSREMRLGEDVDLQSLGACTIERRTL